MPRPAPLLLTHWRSPGDVVCLTAAVRDLVAAYPKRFAIHVGGSCSELWMNNPHIKGSWGARPPRKFPRLNVSYRLQLSLANETRLHFVTAFHRALSHHLEIPIPVLQPHGDLHLTPEERNTPLISGRYWYLVAGGKADIQVKIWPGEYFQRLVELLNREGISLVQGGAVYPGHYHPVLSGVRSTVGQTSLRDVIRLIYHAEGVISPVTFAMHVAAALHKPCVVIAGGREPWWWEAYFNSADRHFGEHCPAVSVPHRFLHTQGTMECCQTGGCWKTQVVAGPDWGSHDCVNPIIMAQDRRYPCCLTKVTPEIVADAVMSYYDDGALTPI